MADDHNCSFSAGYRGLRTRLFAKCRHCAISPGETTAIYFERAIAGKTNVLIISMCRDDSTDAIACSE